MPGFTFTQPTAEHGYLAQLQEWANYNHVRLEWSDKTLQTGGITTITSYPIIQGYPYRDFKGTGSKLRAARGEAATILVRSGVLAG